MKRIISILAALAFVPSLFAGCVRDAAEKPPVTGGIVTEPHGEYPTP